MRYGFNAYGRAWIPFLTRRLVRAIRRNPFAALLVEGFLLFAMVSLLSTPMAWATENIEEWNESGNVQVEGTLANGAWDGVGTPPAGYNAEETPTVVNSNGDVTTGEEYAQQQQAAQQQNTNDQNNAQDIGQRQASDGGAALDPSMLNARTAISRVNLVVTGLLLPVGIAWASWQIVYIALVCGLLGIDPLDLISAEDEKTPWVAIKRRLVNFATGLALVGVIWLIFELVLFLVANFVGALETNL